MIPARFVLTMGHLIAVIIVFYHFDANVLAELRTNPSPAEKQAARADLEVAWILSLVCFLFDFLGLFGGFSIFMPTVNLFQCIVHFLGALYASWFVLGVWQASTYWYICVFLNVWPACIELFILVGIFAFKVVKY